ncbi:MAG TPA: dethiobiotin synthase [Myxococcales bacterium]|nr:dethiobiotin synthase [Myxococcales bacterium]HIN86029.1 dethiobiotin synthase [Myxococcales bacterium]
MSRTIVVTGTDTGVGKTWVSAALIRALVLSGIRAVGIKPIESGCDGTQMEDGVLLAESGSQLQPSRALLRLKAPIAPPLAADREGIVIDWAGILAQIKTYREDAEVALVEGAGGLLSPLSWQHNSLDLATQLNAEILLVAADKLGSINHTLLSLRVLKQAGINVVGVVFSAPEHADESTGSNAQSLVQTTGLHRVFSLPRLSTVEETAQVLTPILSWLGA